MARRRRAGSAPSCPRTSPAAPTLVEQRLEQAPAYLDWAMFPQPLPEVALAAADDSEPFELRQSLVGVRLQRHDPGDRPVAIQDEHSVSPADLRQIPGEVVLQLGDLHPGHVAMLARSVNPVNLSGACSKIASAVLPR